MEGARWASEQLRSTRVQTLVIWEAVQPEDAQMVRLDPSLWRLFPEHTQLWDPHCISGRWFGQHLREPMRANPTFQVQNPPLVWDAFFLYGPEARWGDAPRLGGAPVIGQRDQLMQALRQQ